MSEPDLFRYVMQSFQNFGQAVTSEVAQSTADRETFGDAELAVKDGRCPPEPEDLAVAMVSAWGKIDFRPLQEIVDR